MRLVARDRSISCTPYPVESPLISCPCCLCAIVLLQLSYLELIHLFVETLDAYFGNVCELDIVFNFQQVYRMLDELINGGEILEISKRAIYKYVTGC